VYRTIPLDAITSPALVSVRYYAFARSEEQKETNAENVSGTILLLSFLVLATLQLLKALNHS
jgi:hypothetical protein